MSEERIYLDICIYIYAYIYIHIHTKSGTTRRGAPRSGRRVSKGFALTWYRALTWYFLRLSSPRTHFEPWTAVGTRGRGSLAAR